MTLQEFERIAKTAWNEIPSNFKAGIDGLVIEKDAHAHPDHEDFFTLGECVTEAYPSDFGGPDSIRSSVVLYYGSFRAVAHDDPDFSWEDEVSETLMHELQHHLEHLASDDKLADFDYAVEENFKRVEGQPFDPLFFRAGEELASGWFRVEDDVFMELQARDGAARIHEVRWLDERYHVAVPASDADVLYVVIDHEMPGVRGDFCVVRVRRKGVLGTLRAALGSDGYTMEEVFVKAERT